MCYVCGLNYENFFPWGPDGQTPSHDICGCCGVEFGYEDTLAVGIKMLRLDLDPVF